MAAASSVNHEQCSESAASSQWRFSYPSATLDEETEERNSKCTPKENGMFEKAKTGSPPRSAITGGIPCYFQESRYSSHLLAGMELVIKKEKHQVTEVPEQSSSRVILVSRVLKGIPHSPHFALKGYSEVAKDSLINAWDHVFEQVVDQIQSMEVKSFWVDVKRFWETMGELEKMGYNVITVRRRLVELTDVMLRLRRRKSEIIELKSKAEEHRMEKSRLEFEIMKLKTRVEAEKARHEEIIVKVDEMEQEVPHFDDVFSKTATKKIEIR